SRFAAERVGEWARLGASIVGGCCRVRPADIERLAEVAAAG
ncbi:homocysteine S-methyltransferase family protein, partial [Nocardia sp. JMUB6875]